MAERKELLKSQRELLRLKMAQASAVQAEVQTTINIIATELGIDIQESWLFSPEGGYFEKVEEKPKK